MDSQLQIILLSLPPTPSRQSAPGLEALKAFMNANGIPTTIWYLNVMFDAVMSNVWRNFGKAADAYENGPNDASFLRLMPFLNQIANNDTDATTKKRIEMYLAAAVPDWSHTTDPHYARYSKLLLSALSREIIDRLQGIPREGKYLFGFSCKFWQWIPAHWMIGYIREVFPTSTIVMGGFRRKLEASEMMKLVPQIDLSVWGEGEYPLLRIAEQVSSVDPCLDQIGGVLCRQENEEIVSTKKPLKREYIDFKNPDFWQHDDYINEYNKVLKKFGKFHHLPISSVRGCSWNRCNFCTNTHGNVYRERSVESIVEEIEINAKKHNLNRFAFVDADIVSKNRKRFDALLDGIINSAIRTGIDYQLVGEVLPHHFNASMIKKLFLAGFVGVQIGYESISDSMLEKLNKQTRFADNILFVKFALKYGIRVDGANILTGIPFETIEEVKESIANLHFLRFYLSNKPTRPFRQNHCALGVEYGARYWDMLDEKDRRLWNYASLESFIPRTVFDIDGCKTLFSFIQKNSDHSDLWNFFFKKERWYLENDCDYKIIFDGTCHIFREYQNRKETTRIRFNEADYWEVLQASNDEVVSLEKLKIQMGEKGMPIGDERLLKILEELRNVGLLYYSSDYSKIVSIIDTENVMQ